MVCETIWVSKRLCFQWSKKVGWQSKWVSSPNKIVFTHLDRYSSFPAVPISGSFHNKEAQACYCDVKCIASKMSFPIFTDDFSKDLHPFVKATETKKKMCALQTWNDSHEIWIWKLTEKLCEKQKSQTYCYAFICTVKSNLFFQAKVIVEKCH